jgi:fumarate reductase subunit C
MMQYNNTHNNNIKYFVIQRLTGSVNFINFSKEPIVITLLFNYFITMLCHSLHNKTKYNTNNQCYIELQYIHQHLL